MILFTILLPCYHSEINSPSFFKLINDKIHHPETSSQIQNLASQSPHIDSATSSLDPLIKQLVQKHIDYYEASRPKCACEKESLVQSIVDGPVGGAIGGWIATYGSRFVEFLFSLLISYLKKKLTLSLMKFDYIYDDMEITW